MAAYLSSWWRCWKHSLQYTSRPCRGSNGTVVGVPQAAQIASKLTDAEWGPRFVGLRVEAGKLVDTACFAGGQSRLREFQGEPWQV